MYPLENFTQTNALAILTAVFYYKSLTLPNAPIPNVELMNKSWFERSIWFRTTSSKGVVCAMSFLDVASALRLSRDPNSCAASLGLSTTPVTAIIGAATTIVAGLLRVWCFAELGTLFDFAFNIKADHRLVTTGPYAYVRHPSYTGCFAAYIGATIFMYAPGQWLSECGSGSVVGLAVSCVWFWNLVVCFYGLGRRMGAEDEGLRRRFGTEWDEFAQRVPCRLIPGIY
ncbi:hypothetical protein PLEOSDRAFT_170681 [Pleurotus ostreatus PC15]|uniref:Protein-S-isoprenylcysteine O-methyltransferase n=1 Tax=Pleurotus ostreatus (strain PC15) TaxID=1137138 RepID=A0A067NKT2_PLEO1|nr:hypothetical protein PLEOSDRAFT_170681 [Pleurotus ostreatus PC15]